MHTVNPGVAGLPRDLKVMQTYDRIQAAFPGGPLPATVVVKADDVDEAEDPERDQGDDRQGDRPPARCPARSPPARRRTRPSRSSTSRCRATGTDKASRDRARDAAQRGHPATMAAREVNVTGMTAGSKDFNDTMKSHLPFVFAFVLGLAFILLLVTFRSVVVPLKAIVLNLLSVGAAYGVLTWIFQDGHLEGVLGFHSVGASRAGCRCSCS
jgi:RND superfamily putative drug exporter